jgi:succinyl-CoA---D-citramalate CoA-transferase
MSGAMAYLLQPHKGLSASSASSSSLEQYDSPADYCRASLRRKPSLMTTKGDVKGLMSGIRIVELGHVLAGPFTTALCADFGAEVIKIEDPEQGDIMRSMGPSKNGRNFWWKVVGRNKKCVTINLKHPRGIALCRKILAEADALVENYRPGALDRLGLGHKALRELNPRLVIVSISGYGLTGPDASKSGYGRNAEGMSGLMHLIGEPDGPPLSPGLSVADTTSGLMGAFGLMMALYRRDAGGGPPATIDIGLFETLTRMLDWQIILYDQLGVVPKRSGAKYPIDGAFISNICQCADEKWVTVSGPAVSMRKALAVMDTPGLTEDPRFLTDGDLHRNAKTFGAILSDWVARQTRDEALRLLTLAGATCGPIYDVTDIISDPQYLARGGVATVPDPDFGSLRMVGIVPTIPEAPGKIKWTGPALGQHNREVFADLLQISDAELESLKLDGAI